MCGRVYNDCLVKLFHQRLFLQSNSNEYAMFDHCRDLFLILSSGFVGVYLNCLNKYISTQFIGNTLAS